jgi:hypothetical protein
VTSRERAEAIYALMGSDQSPEEDISSITTAIDDALRKQALDHLSEMGQCFEEHVWPGHPKYEAAIRAAYDRGKKSTCMFDCGAPGCGGGCRT